MDEAGLSLEKEVQFWPIEGRELVCRTITACKDTRSSLNIEAMPSIISDPLHQR